MHIANLPAVLLSDMKQKWCSLAKHKLVILLVVSFWPSCGPLLADTIATSLEDIKKRVYIQKSSSYYYLGYMFVIMVIMFVHFLSVC